MMEKISVVQITSHCFIRFRKSCLVVVFYDPNTVVSRIQLASKIKSVVDISGITDNTDIDQEKYMALEEEIQPFLGGSRDEPKCYLLILEPRTSEITSPHPDPEALDDPLVFSSNSTKKVHSEVFNIMQETSVSASTASNETVLKGTGICGQEESVLPFTEMTSGPMQLDIESILWKISMTNQDLDSSKEVVRPAGPVLQSTKAAILEYLTKSKEPKITDSRPRLVYISPRPNEYEGHDFSLTPFQKFLAFQYISSTGQRFGCRVLQKLGNLVGCRNPGKEGIIFYTSARREGVTGEFEIRYKVFEERVVAVFFDPRGKPDLPQMAPVIGEVIRSSGVYTLPSGELKEVLDPLNRTVQAIVAHFIPSAPFAYLTIFENSGFTKNTKPQGTSAPKCGSRDHTSQQSSSSPEGPRQSENSYDRFEVMEEILLQNP